MTSHDRDVPKSFGLFSPVGHVLASFPSDDMARAAVDAFKAAGSAAEDVHFAAATDVARHASTDIDNAGFLADIGQDLNLAKSHLALARRGHGFVTVRAENQEAAERIADIARRAGAGRAQRYGRFIIEEMIEPGTGEQQVAESPARGLDAQTQSGVEIGR